MRTKRRTITVMVVLAAVTAGGCGTRRDMDEIAATYGQSMRSPAGDATPAPATTGDPAFADRLRSTGTGAAATDAVPDVGAPFGGGSAAATRPSGGVTAGTGAAAAAERRTAGPGAPPSAPGRTDGGAHAPGPGGTGSPAVPPAPAPSGVGAASPGGAPIKIASVGTYSGIVGQNVAPGVKALQAWAAGVNAGGGLAGHRIDLVVADDGGDPARQVALIQQLVERNGVIAFAYNAAPLSGQASVDYVTRKRVPVIGSEMASDWFYSSPMLFPQGTSGRLIPFAGVGAAADLLKPEGKTRLGMLSCSDGIQICKDADEVAEETARVNGLELVYRGQASLAQPDFTAECLNAQRAGAQIIAIAMDANSANRIARSCASVGYRPAIALNQPIVYRQQITDPNLQGSTTASLVAPWTSTNIPGIAEYHEAMARYAPGVEASGSAMAGWVVGKMFERVAANGLPATVTSETILAGLWTFNDEKLGGVTSPLTFVKDQPAPRRVCYGRLRIKDRQLINADGGRMVCR